jgi:hypothetical protein
MISIYAESIEQAIMEYIEKRSGIPCSEMEKYSMKLVNSGYIDSHFVSTQGDLKCAKIEIDIPGIDLEVD